MTPGFVVQDCCVAHLAYGLMKSLIVQKYVLHGQGLIRDGVILGVSPLATVVYILIPLSYYLLNQTQ
jgi:hypothetical protein